jgi:molybdopterin converting factor small subunit
MRITIEVLGLPALAQALGRREATLSLRDGPETVQGVLDHMVDVFGPSVREALYNPTGSLNPVIQIALNGRTFVAPTELDRPLKDGDTLSFMLLMAGGASP